MKPAVAQGSRTVARPHSNCLLCLGHASGRAALAVVGKHLNEGYTIYREMPPHPCSLTRAVVLQVPVPDRHPHGAVHLHRL